MPNSSSVPPHHAERAGAGRGEGQDRLVAAARPAGSRRRRSGRTAPCPSCRRLLLGRGAVQLDVGQQREGVLEVDVARPHEQHAAQPVGRHDRPGGVVEGQVVRRAGRRRRPRRPAVRRASTTRVPAGSSSMTTSARVSGSSTRSRAVTGVAVGQDLQPAHARSRRSSWRRSRRAFASGPRDRRARRARRWPGCRARGRRSATRTGTSSTTRGTVVPASSVTTSTSAPRARSASASASLSASVRSDAAVDASIDSIARAIRPRSVASLATTRAVSPAATTLTRPSAGTWASCSMASALGGRQPVGEHVGRRTCWRDASTTSTRSRARPAGCSANGRATTNASSTASSSWSSSSSERRSLCHGAFASTSRTSVLPQDRWC